MPERVAEQGSVSAAADFQHDAKKAGGTGEVALPDCVAGAIRKSWMQHTIDQSVRFQKVCDFQARCLMPRHAQRQRAEAAQRKCGFIARHAQAKLPHGRAEPLEMAGSRGHAAHHQIGMAAHIFGKRLHDHVATGRDSLEKMAGGPGVVQQGGDAGGARRRGHRGNILHLESEGTGGFQQQQAGVGAEQRGNCSANQRIIGFCLYAESLCQPENKAGGRIIGTVWNQQMIATLAYGEDCRRERCNAAGHQHRSSRARLQPGERLAQCPGGWTALAAIKQHAILIEIGRIHRGDRGIDDGGRAKDRRVDNAECPLGPPACFNSPGFRGQGFGVFALAQAPVTTGVSGWPPHSAQLPS